MMERNENIELELIDYETALAIMGDIQGREAWSTPKVLAQWVATVRNHAMNEEHRRIIG